MQDSDNYHVKGHQPTLIHPRDPSKCEERYYSNSYAIAVKITKLFSQEIDFFLFLSSSGPGLSKVRLGSGSSESCELKDLTKT